jgi:hypothetical protein
MSEITLVIHRGGNRIEVRGKLSRKGWNIHRAGDDPGGIRLGHCKRKDEAIRLACDCCEPDVAGAVFLVTPAT